MPKIALISIYPSSHYENYEEIIQSISEWQDVTKEELSLLKQYYAAKRGYIIVEFIDNQKEKIEFAVNAQLKAAKEWEEKLKKEKEERERKALERKLKKEKKTLEDKRKLLEELKSELGED